MSLELFPLLAAMAFYAVLGALMAFARFDTRNIIMWFALTVALFYGFRPLLILAGFDAASPDGLFGLTELGHDMGVTLLWLALYLLLFGVGAAVAFRVIRGRGTLIFARSVPSVARMVALTATLTVLSTIIMIYLLREYSSVGGLISSVKYEKELAGFYVLKVPSAVGAVVAAGGFLDSRGRSAFGTRSFLLAASLLNAAYIFAWGQRSIVVVVAAILLLGVRPLKRHGNAVSRRKVVARILLAVVLIVGASAGLRIVRDTLSSGQVFQVYSEASVWRQMSLATNATYFDATVLAFRDWPEQFAYRDGEDFVTGASGPVPRLVWEDKPTSVRPGQWFRQTYEPQTVNGWPVGAPTVWYLNFGPIGLIFGGLLSGALYGWLRRAQTNAASSGLNSAITIVTTVFVLELGWSSDTPLVVAIWLVPMWFVVRFVSTRLGGSSPASPAPLPASTLSGTRLVRERALR